MKEALRRKIGPFPAWAWLGFVLLLALVLWMRRRNAAKAAAAAAATDPNAAGDVTLGGPNGAPAGQYDQAMIPAGSPGSPAGGSLPIDLIITFQNATAPKAAVKAKPKPKPKPRPRPRKLTPHQLHLLHQRHLAHIGAS